MQRLKRSNDPMVFLVAWFLVPLLLLLLLDALKVAEHFERWLATLG